MRIKLLTSMVGPNTDRQYGQVLTVPDDLSRDEANRLIERGLAELDRTESVETAVIPPPERAVRRGRAKRGP